MLLLLGFGHQLGRSLKTGSTHIAVEGLCGSPGSQALDSA
jgi:hypothetical protein